MIPKFRVWDKISHGWRHDVYIGLDGLAKDLSRTGEEPFELPLDNVIIMQSTGVFDKNGKEIFEGDVVNIFDEKLSKIYFSEGAFCVDVLNGGTPLHVYLSEHLELIGNIYENPELMEG
ncbi:YopX family protein [Streptococcus suis]